MTGDRRGWETRDSFQPELEGPAKVRIFVSIEAPNGEKTIQEWADPDGAVFATIYADPLESQGGAGATGNPDTVALAVCSLLHSLGRRGLLHPIARDLQRTAPELARSLLNHLLIQKVTQGGKPH